MASPEPEGNLGGSGLLAHTLLRRYQDEPGAGPPHAAAETHGPSRQEDVYLGPPLQKLQRHGCAQAPPVLPGSGRVGTQLEAQNSQRRGALCREAPGCRGIPS